MAPRKQRSMVIVAGVATAIISMICIVLLFVAFLDYRREDFALATSTDDLSTLGTCIEAPSLDLIDQQSWVNEDWKCRVDERKELAAMLAASVHTLYHTMLTVASPSDALVHTTTALLAATMGVTDGYSVNASLATVALREIGDATLPKECSSIYSGESIYSDAIEAGVAPSPKYVTVTCDHALIGPSVNVSNVEKAMLLAHCLTQFSFGTSGPVDGSGHLPVFGEAPGPSFWPWTKPANFSGATPNTKARVYLGLRFQWSVFGYLLLMLTLAFCTVDGIMVLVSEGTVEERGRGAKQQLDKPSRVRRALRIMGATFFAKRSRRWAILFFLIFFTGTTLLVYVWLPWDFGHRLGRPDCEINKDENQLFRVVPGTRGGWRSDWDATILEILCLAWTIVALFLTPIARQIDPIFKVFNSQEIPVSRQDSEVPSSSVARLATTTGAQQVWAITGTVILVAAYTISGSTFASAWTDAVMGKPVSWTARRVSECASRFEPPLRFPLHSELFLCRYVYTHALNGIFAMIAAGMTIAVIQGRWLIDGVGCSATLVVFVWILLAMVPFGLLFVTIGIETFSDRSESVADCEIFDGGFESEVCLVKWILLLVGTGMLAIVIVYMSVGAFLNRIRMLSSAKSSRVEVSNGSAASADAETLLGKTRLKPWRLPIRFQPFH